MVRHNAEIVIFDRKACGDGGWWLAFLSGRRKENNSTV